MTLFQILNQSPLKAERLSALRGNPDVEWTTSSYVASGLGVSLSASLGFSDSISGHMTGWGEPLVGSALSIHPPAPQHCSARRDALQEQARYWHI